MKKIRFLIGEVVGYALLLTGIARLLFNARMARGEITAFCFHNPPEMLFRRLVTMGRKWGLQFISADSLYACLQGNERPDAPACFISTDDGWRDNLKNISAYAEQVNVPICYFIATDALSSGEFWWCRMTPASKIQRLKIIPNKDRIVEVNKYTPVSSRVAMTATEVANLSKLQHATIGNHTHAHPILPRCSEEEVYLELTHAHSQLKALTAKAPTVFAFPNGDYDYRSAPVLKRLGYLMAFTTEAKGIQPDEIDLFRLPRFSENANGGFAENFCRMIGVWQPLFTPLKRVVRKLKHAPRGLRTNPSI